MGLAASQALSEASTTAFTDFPAQSPNPRGSTRWCMDSSARPPAPMSLSTAMGNAQAGARRFVDDDSSEVDVKHDRRMMRVGSSEGRLLKSKDKQKDDGLGGI